LPKPLETVVTERILSIFELVLVSEYLLSPEPFAHFMQAPPTVYYIPDFVTEAEESGLLQEIARSPAPRWTQLSNR
jgi:hypothetical protein